MNLPMEDYTFLALQQEFNGVSQRTFNSIINDCINTFKLFASDDESFWSESLKRAAWGVMDKKEGAGTSSGACIRLKTAKAKEKERPFNDRSTTVQQVKESKVKESKVNKKIEERYTRRSP